MHIVLVHPEIAANTGAIGRTCVALGAALWLVRPLGFRIGDRSRRRAGLDYWDHLEWTVVNDFDTITKHIDPARFWFFSTKGQTCYTQALFRPGDALVFGSETRGLPRSLLEQDFQRTLRIPMRSEARSLNLSCAVAIASYEAFRQFP